MWLALRCAYSVLRVPSLPTGRSPSWGRRKCCLGIFWNWGSWVCPYTGLGRHFYRSEIIPLPDPTVPKSLRVLLVRRSRRKDEGRRIGRLWGHGLARSCIFWWFPSSCRFCVSLRSLRLLWRCRCGFRRGRLWSVVRCLVSSGKNGVLGGDWVWWWLWSLWLSRSWPHLHHWPATAFFLTKWDMPWGCVNFQRLPWVPSSKLHCCDYTLSPTY